MMERSIPRWANERLAHQIFLITRLLADQHERGRRAPLARNDLCGELILVPEEDRDVNPAGVKGIGELANVGTAAAVANAVYHATGRRIRDLPIRIEKLL
jgi:hypothetical protein